MTAAELLAALEAEHGPEVAAVAARYIAGEIPAPRRRRPPRRVGRPGRAGAGSIVRGHVARSKLRGSRRR